MVKNRHEMAKLTPQASNQNRNEFPSHTE